MSAIATKQTATLEQVLITGNLADLSPEQRVVYYRQVCESLGVNELTKPFDYITLNGKLRLYATKDCTDQLRKRDKVSVRIASRESIEGVFVVTADATLPDGRTDSSTGAVPIANVQGEARANAMMKAETKAKRRVTLSICGLGMLDESEVESIPGARVGESNAPKQLTEAKPADGELVNSLEKVLRAAAGNAENLAASAELIKQNHEKLTEAGKEYLRGVYREVERWVAPNREPVNEDSEPAENEVPI